MCERCGRKSLKNPIWQPNCQRAASLHEAGKSEGVSFFRALYRAKTCPLCILARAFFLHACI